MDVRKLLRPPKAAEKFWPFFFVQNQDFSGNVTNFGAFQNLGKAWGGFSPPLDTDVRIWGFQDVTG